MTAKQCGKIALEILREKILHNDQCLESGVNLATLRNFTELYLTRKYPSKKQAEEIMNAFAEGLKAFDKSDVHVKLFNHIADNKIDENFVLIYEEARSSLVDALTVNS